MADRLIVLRTLRSVLEAAETRLRVREAEACICGHLRAHEIGLDYRYQWYPDNDARSRAEQKKSNINVNNALLEWREQTDYCTGGWVGAGRLVCEMREGPLPTTDAKKDSSRHKSDQKKLKLTGLKVQVNQKKSKAAGSKVQPIECGMAFGDPQSLDEWVSLSSEASELVRGVLVPPGPIFVSDPPVNYLWASRIWMRFVYEQLVTLRNPPFANVGYWDYGDVYEYAAAPDEEDWPGLALEINPYLASVLAIDLALSQPSRLETKQPEHIHPDGPEPPHFLWWHNQRYRIGKNRSRLSYRLLEFFWNREAADFEDLQGYGLPWDDPPTDSAVATAVTRFNVDLPPCFPWKLRTKDRRVYKDFHENPSK